MNYNEIDVERIVDEVVTAEEQGKLRNATKQETMIVRLAALSTIVRKMQLLVENDKELGRNKSCNLRRNRINGKRMYCLRF